MSGQRPIDNDAVQNSMRVASHVIVDIIASRNLALLSVLSGVYAYFLGA